MLIACILILQLFYNSGFYLIMGLPCGSDGKVSACNRGDPGFDSWVRKIPWRRKWQPTPLSCLGNPMNRGSWWAIVSGVAEGLDMT